MGCAYHHTRCSPSPSRVSLAVGKEEKLRRAGFRAVRNWMRAEAAGSCNTSLARSPGPVLPLTASLSQPRSSPPCAACAREKAGVREQPPSTLLCLSALSLPDKVWELGRCGRTGSGGSAPHCCPTGPRLSPRATGLKADRVSQQDTLTPN